MSQILVTGEAKIRDIQGPVVSNSGVITALDGDASQYVRGDGTLADFPTSTGGGSSVSYYLNSSVSQGTIGGVAYRQLSKTPISGAGTDITASTNGYIASYITDANDPALLEVPAGNFNCEFYFSVNSNSHNPYVYAELYKYDGTTFTLLGSNVAIPEYLTNGTTLSAYYFAIPVAVAALTITDRLAIRIYVNVDGRVVTLHTENNHLCQVVTTFSKGLISLNNLTRQNQLFATGTSGTDFGISSSVATHTFNLPVASAANTGKLSSTDWSTFNNKASTADLANYLLLAGGTLTGALGGTSALFTGNLRTDTGLGLKYGSFVSTSGYLNLFAALAGSTMTLNIKEGTGGFESALQFNNSANRSYAFPNADGTIALTSDISYPVTSVFGRTGAVVATEGDYSLTQLSDVTITSPSNGQVLKYNGTAWINDTDANTGTVTSVGLSSATSGVTIGSSPITTSGTITISIATASGSLNGLLSSTDWTTFNNKQNALTNPITGTGSINRISKFNGTGSITDSNIRDEDGDAIEIYKNGSGSTSAIFQIVPFTATNASLIRLYNEGDGAFWAGRQNSAGNSLLVTSLGAYDSVVGHTGTQTLHLITGSLSRLSISGSGVSTFNGNLIISTAPSNTVGAGNSLYLSGNTGSSYTYLQQGVGQFLIFGFNATSWNQNLSINSSSGNSVFRGSITASNFTGSSSGTNTGDQNLSAYVPYTGATTNVTLGTNSLTASNLIVDQGVIGLSIRFKQYASASYNTDGYTDIYAVSNNVIGFACNQGYGNFKGFNFLVNNITLNENRSLYIPNATGTIALTSDLSAYLPLAGGTLTGALNGTSATFSSSVTAGGAISSDQTDGGVIFTKTAGASVGLFTNTFQIQGSGTKTDLNAYVYGANPFGIWTNGSQKFIVTSAGNVGIGISAPVANLDVSSANTTAFFRVGSTSSGTAGSIDMYASGTGGFQAGTVGFNTANNVNFLFNIGGTERMRITSDGNVGIGTSSPETFSNYKTLEVSSTSGGVFFAKSTTGSITAQLVADNGTSSAYVGTRTNHAFSIRTNNTDKILISSAGVVTITNLGTGTVTATSGVLSAVSDMNLKDEDGFIDNALEKVLKLKPRYYHWKEESGLPTDLRQLGFYAQEVNEALGEEAANTPKTENDKWGIYDRGIIAFLTAAIQEQQAQIEELKALIKNK
jgi:hypothetical protein